MPSSTDTAAATASRAANKLPSASGVSSLLPTSVTNHPIISTIFIAGLTVVGWKAFAEYRRKEKKRRVARENLAKAREVAAANRAGNANMKI